MSYIDLSGYWKTGSGAEYRLIHMAPYVTAFYAKPSEGQLSTGIKPGDVAYQGTLIGNILVGKFYHQFSADIQERCPNLAGKLMTDMNLEVSEDAQSFSGSLLLIHASDAGCTIDDRALARLVFQRIQNPDPTTEAALNINFDIQSRFVNGG